MDARPSLMRRRGRRLLLRTIRLVRHHYGSLFTLLVLSVALVFVLRSPDFARRSVAESQTPETQGSRAELLSALKKDEALPNYQIAFYVYAEESQRRPVEEYLRHHLRFLRQQGYPPGVMEVNFLHVTNEAEEIEAIKLVSQVAGWVAGRDIHLSVIDLR